MRFVEFTQEGGRTRYIFPSSVKETVAVSDEKTVVMLRTGQRVVVIGPKEEIDKKLEDAKRIDVV